MAIHPNATLVHRLYEAFDRKDVPSISALIADDAVWHVPGSTLISGGHRGRSAIFEYFRRMAELSDATFHAKLVDVLTSDTHAVAVATATGRRAAQSYEGRYLLLMRIRDRQIVEAHLFNEDQAAFESFWS
jgi:ketosteroid isomerase-like protein